MNPSVLIGLFVDYQGAFVCLREFQLCGIFYTPSISNVNF